MHAPIVVGVDGSQTSWNAFWWAAGEARRLERPIIAVFVSSSGTVTAGVSAATGVAVSDIDALDRAAGGRATEIQEQLIRWAGEHGVEVRFVQARGDAAVELIRVATANRAAQIVVGRSTKAVHQLVGSIGGRLISSRDSPVVVVVP